MTPVDVIALVAAVASWAALLAQWLRNRNKNTADYANAAFHAWEQLAARMEQREHDLLEEMSKLRREVGLLRRVLVKHGIPVPEVEHA